MTACLDEDQVLVYVQGELEPPARDRIDAHLAACSACCELVAETARLMEGEHAVTLTGPAPPPVDEVPSTLVAGTRVGRYALQAVIGRGGMSVVYAAQDPELHRRVAIKLLRPEVLEKDGEDSTTRLFREARAMARVSHPNVVAIHDVGEWRGQVFVAMELVVGRTLRAVLKDSRVAWPERLDLFVEAGRGLAAAHGAGLVHRDFKPENVLVGDDGRVRVTDFGLAKPARGELPMRAPAASLDVLATVTSTGHVSGTPAYMAPEQFLGGLVDARADQFAFCVALYEGLFGTRPFAGKAAKDIARNVLESRVSPIVSGADVPRALRAVVERGLSRAPEHRYASLAELLAALGAARGARPPVSTRPDGPAPELAARARTRRRVGIGVAAVTVLGLLAVGLGVASRGEREGARVNLGPVADPGHGPGAALPPARAGLEPPSPAEGATVTGAAVAEVPASSVASGPLPHAPRTTTRGAKRNRAVTTPPPAAATSPARKPAPIGDRVENPF